ncbi:hypothetical protein EJ05DRAFT_523924 [Pseudovirgaria hyperparasitica]|uniref:Uncharacterized protein n=1 Tax=Pseudovirgaria hyperparasitica TaxID=470096 RepID=A0A6A6WHY4_9PEZI|nr:uncharacterized protein EJ05DRAFT_523924 [Pseudovirgaria hyperparasitica]KAF2760761.1 hypothetical protein EJ05DRAFT_523924 [Pseudovirgaria hyperparasitica]
MPAISVFCDSLLLLTINDRSESRSGNMTMTELEELQMQKLLKDKILDQASAILIILNPAIVVGRSKKGEPLFSAYLTGHDNPRSQSTYMFILPPSMAASEEAALASLLEQIQHAVDTIYDNMIGEDIRYHERGDKNDSHADAIAMLWGSYRVPTSLSQSGDQSS